jgi:hypothetical protein
LTADSTCSKDDEEEKAHLSFTSETTLSESIAHALVERQRQTKTPNEKQTESNVIKINLYSISVRCQRVYHYTTLTLMGIRK